MWQFIAIYRRPEDPEAFERYYRDVHIPLVHQFPGLRRMTFSRVEAEGGAGVGPALCFISTMYFDSRSSLDFALRSAARQVAYEDSAKFREYQIGRYVGPIEEV